jgi:hypothetical protein
LRLDAGRKQNEIHRREECRNGVSFF